MPNSNIEQLIGVAELLRPLLDELVFVGGAVTGLLVTDDAAGDPRPTLDVDAIAGITSYLEYAVFGERLRALGFSEDTRAGAPVCRWVHGSLILDVMPVEGNVLGFSNRWYRATLDSATPHKVSGNLTIRIITAPFFVATKLEAFKERGKGDLFASHDLEDIVYLIDGRAGLVDEIRAQPSDLQAYIHAV